MVLRAFRSTLSPVVKFIIGVIFVMILITLISNEGENELSELDIYLTHRLSQIKKSCGEICDTREHDLIQGEMIYSCTSDTNEKSHLIII